MRIIRAGKRAAGGTFSLRVGHDVQTLDFSRNHETEVPDELEVTRRDGSVKTINTRWLLRRYIDQGYLDVVSDDAPPEPSRRRAVDPETGEFLEPLLPKSQRKPLAELAAADGAAEGAAKGSTRKK